MFSTLRNRFGIPGVISVVALVFAMFGGAYAASNSSGGGKATASAKAKKGPRGPKGPTGPLGPVGPAGPAGPAGPQGPKGDAGANCSPGANGASVTVSAVGLPGEEGKCVGSGGSKFVVGASKAYACNGAPGTDGAPGEPWTAGGTLPAGATETGTWSFQTQVESMIKFASTFVPLSFPIPLAQPLDEAHVHLAPNANCPGSVETPKANSGHLCIYTGLHELASADAILKSQGGGFEGGANTAGASLFVSYEGQPDPGAGQFPAIVGTWAVTG
jgi:hypothetical protein